MLEYKYFVAHLNQNHQTAEYHNQNAESQIRCFVVFPHEKGLFDRFESAGSQICHLKGPCLIIITFPHRQCYCRDYEESSCIKEEMYCEEFQKLVIRSILVWTANVFMDLVSKPVRKILWQLQSTNDLLSRDTSCLDIDSMLDLPESMSHYWCFWYWLQLSACQRLWHELSPNSFADLLIRLLNNGECVD